MPNFHNKQPTWQNDEVVNSGNNSQRLQDTKVGEGLTGIVINGGNFINCVFPLDAEVNGGLHMQIDYCKHEHPKWDELPDEDDDCRHVTDTILLDGVTLYTREDTIISTGAKHG